LSEYTKINAEDYKKVDWEKAECRRLEIYTDLFYQVEEERSTNAYDHINSLRAICASCPIWKECLTYAFANENYGMWGGMTSQERVSMSQPLSYPNQRVRGLKSLAEHGIFIQEIKECMKEAQ
jgi:WhiB family redox-sensing transcriptional regulator